VHRSTKVLISQKQIDRTPEEPKDMIKKKIRIGVIGAGEVARLVYIPNMLKIPNLEVAAICDLQEVRADCLQAMFGIREVYYSVDEMLGNSDIEAVAILTPIPTHAQLAITAAQAGKHIYMEKPIAMSLEDADTVIRAAAEAGVKLTVAPPLILDARMQFIKELIDEGAIGHVCFVRAQSSNRGPARLFGFSTDMTWFYKPGGGPLFDMGVYAIQDLIYVLGPVTRVMAMTGRSIPEVRVRSGPIKGQIIDVKTDDNNLMLLDFGNATFASIDASYCAWATDGPTRQFYGSDGVLSVNPFGAPVPFRIYKEDLFGIGGWTEPDDCIPGGAGLGLRFQIAQQKRNLVADYSLAAGVAHLTDCILQDRLPLLSGEMACHVLEIVLAAVESGRTGRAVELGTSF
jgi:predicted dehydrogenase